MPLPQRGSPTEPASSDRFWRLGHPTRMSTPVALCWITGDVLARNGSRNSMTRIRLLRGLKHGQSEPSSTVSSNHRISRTLAGWDERRSARSTTDGGITLLPATTVGTTSSMTWWFCLRFPRLSMSPHRPFVGFARGCRVSQGLAQPRSVSGVSVDRRESVRWGATACYATLYATVYATTGA